MALVAVILVVPSSVALDALVVTLAVVTTMFLTIEVA